MGFIHDALVGVQTNEILFFRATDGFQTECGEKLSTMTEIRSLTG